MKLAVLIDPLDQLFPEKDSTIALLKEAQKRGWDCFYFTQNKLYSQNGCVYAQVSQIQINDVHSPRWAETSAVGDSPLTDFDIILMRKDPPVDTEYLYNTHLLELAENAGVLVSNKPQGLRDANEKLFTLYFTDFCPHSLVSSSINKLYSFWQEQGRNVVFKPLNGMGGRGVFHVNEQGQNISVILETLTKGQKISIMAQQYLPAIQTSGDKRIILINGEAVSYGLSRLPAVGESRGNLAAGGKGIVSVLTPREKLIAQRLKRILQEKGLDFVGIDVIGDHLTEINVTSPTCIVEIETETGIDIAGSYLNFLAERCIKGR